MTNTAPTELTQALVVEGLVFGVRGLRILDGVSFGVRVSETVGIIGPNGSGKTTLFNCLSGFNRAQRGRISLLGQEITTLSPSARACRGLGRVFQNSGIFREMTVIENLVTACEGKQALARTFFPWSTEHRLNRERSMALLSEIKLEKRAKDKASSLSGGQLRLLEIVRMLAFGAEVFLLDEPTAGVSPRMKDEVVQIIQRLRALNKTVLVIEHDINFIQKFCDRIIVMNVGQVVMDDAPQKVRENPQLQEIYFGAG